MNHLLIGIVHKITKDMLKKPHTDTKKSLESTARYFRRDFERHLARLKESYENR